MPPISVLLDHLHKDIVILCRDCWLDKGVHHTPLPRASIFTTMPTTLPNLKSASMSISLNPGLGLRRSVHQPCRNAGQFQMLSSPNPRPQIGAIGRRDSWTRRRQLVAREIIGFGEGPIRAMCARRHQSMGRMRSYYTSICDDGEWKTDGVRRPEQDVGT